MIRYKEKITMHIREYFIKKLASISSTMRLLLLNIIKKDFKINLIHKKIIYGVL